MLDEPTTVPGLRDPGQIHLRVRHITHGRDDLRAARGTVTGAVIGLIIICAVWAFALLLR